MSKLKHTKERAGAKYFLDPETPAQRQYEALRSYILDGLPAEEAARRFGYSPATLYSLCRELRAGRLRFFQPQKPGPKTAPKQDAARERIVELRKQNYSIYDIQKILAGANLVISHTSISQTLRKEGFAKLPRRCQDERPAVPRQEIAEVADVRELDWEDFSHFETEGAGIFVFLPILIEWGIHRWVSHADLPGSRMIPALQSILSLLALKLTGRERIAHVMDVCFDRGFALFAGINVLPKTTALSTYSYRITREMTASLLHSYAKTLAQTGLLPGKSFNLDFHAIPYRGDDHELVEKHYVSQRSRREPAILAFLVQDDDSRALCYANATVRKDGAREEILSFVEFWKETHGKLPPHLVFDSQLTTYDVLAKLDRLGILFITLRRRGVSALKRLQQMSASEWTRIKLQGASRKYTNPEYVESPLQVRPFDHPLRQIAVRGLGREEPTLILTNDTQIQPAPLVERYAHRMLIENSIAENIDFFHLNALSSAIAIQVDLDLMLTLIANAAYRKLASQLEGFHYAKPRQVFRRFLNTTARVYTNEREVFVRLRRCAHHPILLASGALRPEPRVPWWNGRRLHLEIR
jgi:transposase